jgi:hypothetical protein
MVDRDDLQDTMNHVNFNLNMANFDINADQRKQLELYHKHIRALWHHVQRLEKVVQIIPEGVKIKAGISEVTVLNNGGIIIDGLRIRIRTPNKDEFYY